MPTKRGDILYADLSPTVGSEVNQRRPVLIVSNDANNRAASTVTLLPITSNTTRVYPFEVALSPAESGLPKPSKVQAQQIRTIAKERITGPPVGRLTAATLQAVAAAMRLHLSL
ncbi:type II toxin-antitoxin system PemK/MazF family toxin [uncultured Thiodictyon sp.]|uniref:type II toxin-antitoxin system PemK/MazF family toxin n=1 Tax=uncultured Thiodictyon sp. TaxID=1846217 RepID=UPI0025CE53DE|nr:type II toxin-antitoxin system PemK/MazF family toxin [uncultured Thiodictyon sp.]